MKLFIIIACIAINSVRSAPTWSPILGVGPVKIQPGMEAWDMLYGDGESSSGSASSEESASTVDGRGSTPAPPLMLGPGPVRPDPSMTGYDEMTNQQQPLMLGPGPVQPDPSMTGYAEMTNQQKPAKSGKPVPMAPGPVVTAGMQPFQPQN